jgi:hypothetical protein
MKKNISFKQLQYAAAGKRYPYHFTFNKKDSIIRNIEITVVFIVLCIAGAGLYDLFM